MNREELKVWYLVKKARNVEKREDFIWCEVKDKDWYIKIVKNLFHNQLYYAGFNISSNSIHSVEICKFYNDGFWIRADKKEYRENYLKEIERILYNKLGIFDKLIYRNLDRIIGLMLFFMRLKFRVKRVMRLYMPKNIKMFLTKKVIA